MLNACPEDPRITHILRTGEPPQQKYPDDADDEREYIIEERRFERRIESEKGALEHE